MRQTLKIIAAAAAIALAALSAQAATVAVGGTGSTGAGGFVSDIATIDTTNRAYFRGATTPASNWVWARSGFDSNGTIVFTFAFDLTGFQRATASLGGLWGVDNQGRVELNGTQVSSLAFNVRSFNRLTSFTGAGAMFKAGMNELKFYATNRGGPGAFRASVTVTAAVVPLPAALPLLGTALLAGGFIARRAKRGGAAA